MHVRGAINNGVTVDDGLDESMTVSLVQIVDGEIPSPSTISSYNFV